ncbi:phosphoribosyltransferase family protein [Mesorhizobium sp. GbtcB19]|uniref:phosphoribosyltransferase family protein n=1 Tax=Mesorhizobium sp. GbtcB19 TaxID=2824764 RepID=UPI001C3039CB|nr:phosphoribosyltransferase family protein [Mesorhizobium sp. GbtcB19]
MTEEFPKRIFFFNDAEFAIEGKASAHEIDHVRRAFSQVARYIKSPEVSVIDYQLCRLNFKTALKPAYYDEVICLGGKGLSLYDKVRHLLTADRVRQLKIKRVFEDESLDGFDFGMAMTPADHAELETITAKRVLVVDDVIYTGRTLDYVLGRISGSNAISILTMVVMEETRDQLDRPLFAGLIIPGGPWSGRGEEQDLWCFRDLIESDAVVYSTGKSQSFIEREDIMKRYLFGDDYGAVSSIIGEIRHLFQ